MNRYAAIDYGARRIGLALSDPEGKISLPYKVLTVSSPENALLQIVQALEEYSFKEVILGLPLHLDGREGEKAKEVRAFGEKLEKKLNCPIVYFDERLTTVQAEHLLKERGFNRKKRMKHIDALSAQVILQDYLDTLKLY